MSARNWQFRPDEAQTQRFMHADRPGFEIEGERVAGELGLETAEFRMLMEQGRIAVLCERGTGEDEGLLRASFYHGKRRARFLIDRAGNIQPG